MGPFAARSYRRAIALIGNTAAADWSTIAEQASRSKRLRMERCGKPSRDRFDGNPFDASPDLTRYRIAIGLDAVGTNDP